MYTYLPCVCVQVKGDVSITVSEASPESSAEPPNLLLSTLPTKLPVRRGSFSFLQRRPSHNKDAPRLMRHSSAKEHSTRKIDPLMVSRQHEIGPAVYRRADLHS